MEGQNRYVLALVAGRYLYIPVVKCLSVLEKGRDVEDKVHGKVQPTSSFPFI